EWGLDILMAESELRDWKIRTSSPDSTVESKGGKRPPAGAVWKYGEEYQTRSEGCHLSKVQNFEVHPKITPRSFRMDS
ncbi:hypothetical protein AVEN_176209-1, partial [Araneus ventricosus]